MSHPNVELKFLACCYLLVHGSSSGNSSTGCPLLSFTHPELGHGVMWMTQAEQHLDCDQRTHENLLFAIMYFTLLSTSACGELAECLACPFFHLVIGANTHQVWLQVNSSQLTPFLQIWPSRWGWLGQKLVLSMLREVMQNCTMAPRHSLLRKHIRHWLPNSSSCGVQTPLPSGTS